jgi:hypothetical protein
MQLDKGHAREDGGRKIVARLHPMRDLTPAREKRLSSANQTGLAPVDWSRERYFFETVPYCQTKTALEFYHVPELHQKIFGIDTAQHALRFPPAQASK